MEDILYFHFFIQLHPYDTHSFIIFTQLSVNTYLIDSNSWGWFFFLLNFLITYWYFVFQSKIQTHSFSRLFVVLFCDLACISKSKQDRPKTCFTSSFIFNQLKVVTRWGWFKSKVSCQIQGFTEFGLVFNNCLNVFNSLQNNRFPYGIFKNVSYWLTPPWGPLNSLLSSPSHSLSPL